MPATEKTFVDVYEDFGCQSSTTSSGTTSEDEELIPKQCKSEIDRNHRSCVVKGIDTDPAWFANLPNRKRHESFLWKAVEIMINDGFFDALTRTNKVLEWRNPEELYNIIDLKLKPESETHETLLKHVKNVIKYSVKSGHPYFLNQLFTSVDPYGLVGQWLTDVLNISSYTYEVAPVVALMEEEVLKEMRKIVGWVDGEGDGVFCPGGSISNGYAISCARYQLLPNIKNSGLFGLPRLVVFTSESAHYSIKKLATFLGLGADNVYAINSDNQGKMCMEHLESEIQRAIAEGAKPCMVSATSGTTVLGAFDPLLDIAKICKKYNLWMHVDAAWGGGVLMSKKHRHLLNGIEMADSVTWNPHKLLAVPQQCSAFLVRHEKILSECHSTHATYLFQKDKFYDTKFDTGDKHIQCGRRADVVKFWMMWKAKGSNGFEKHVDKIFDNTQYFVNLIKKRDGFEMVLDNPEFVNVSFWYIPPSLRGQQDHPDYKERLHKVAPKIKERMMKEGTMMITYQPLKEYPNFFRLVQGSSALEYSDMIYIADEIERLGQDL